MLAHQSRDLTLAEVRAFKPKPLAELDQLWLKSGFGRRGGKGNRRLQKQRILVFLSYCMSAWGMKSLGQLGRNHVESFFVSRWDLTAKTKQHYWYALRVLWVLLGKSELPPKPVIL
jgi:hypothetical protein